MTQALFTAMTGLNAGTEQLTVVSDNVANMNTTAYKNSRVDFQDVWYGTKTTGTNSTTNSGGTNPYQVGVGVKCSAITRDFGASSITTTGRTQDMALQGDGWFTVINSDGAVMLTRDGSFSLDEEGYICNASGYKVLGMDTNASPSCSDIPLKVPTRIKMTEEPTSIDLFEKMQVSTLNNATFTDGNFNVIVTSDKGATQTTYTIDLGTDVGNLTVEGLVGKINASITAEGAKDYFSAEIIDGSIAFKCKEGKELTPGGEKDVYSLKFESGTSNFVSAANLASATPVKETAPYEYDTKILNMSAKIGQVDDVTSDSTLIYDNYSISKDGQITVTYSDGSSLSVAADASGRKYFTYQDANGIIINADANNLTAGSLYVDPNVLVKANMQCQLAKVTNNNGLVATGGNCYSVGVNCGSVLYTAANINGVGEVTTGALESSNVDLAKQFSNMILAQRLVQANSQVFSSANSILETLVYLGK